MRNLIPLLILSLAISSCIENVPNQAKAIAVNDDIYQQLMDSSVVFDAKLAQKLGADEYGMKPYVMAFLKRGPNRSQDSVTAANLQKAHLENIGKMAKAGKLVVAGPFMDDGDIRGIYIFNVATVEEAQALTATDPAIKAGRLAMELHPWYGSAILPIVAPMHKRLEKNSVTK